MSAVPPNTKEQYRQRLLGAVAAIVSAFVVFVGGGALVIGLWASQRGASQRAPEGGTVSPVAHPAPKASPTAIRPPPAKVKSSKAAASRPKTKTVRAGVSTEQAQSSKPKAAKAAKALAPKSEASPPVTGEGLVMVVGAVSRLRLMGPKGTFGPGVIPAGTYTIQATFDGGAPRMAGTVSVGDGDRIQLMCSAGSHRCTRR